MVGGHGSSEVFEGLRSRPFKNFHLRTLRIESAVLCGNPWNDPTTRYLPTLLPLGKEPAGGWPVVFVLAGFTGNGPTYFNVKSFEMNLPESLDRCADAGDAPRALYVFCDAMTKWGGSQFINSAGMGRYEDYVVDEICSAVLREFRVNPDPLRWCVTGGSSGGYGALSLASRHPDRFAWAGAIAPDSFFEASLLPEIWSAWPTIDKVGGVNGVLAELESGSLMKRKEAHKVLNAVAMGLCYASSGGGVRFPIDARAGTLDVEAWRIWKRHDPVHFLGEDDRSVHKIKSVYLDVGTRDQYHLQFGTRQIHDRLKDRGVEVTYQEFEGTHFDIGARRPALWKWLAPRL